MVKENEWADLKVGDKLDELTIIRTGFRSKVVLAFEDNSTVTIDRASKIGISEFRKQGELTKTQLGLKYGSLRADVEKARGPNDFTVQTPVATLAVRGTAGDIGFTGDFGLNMHSERGQWSIVRGQETRDVQGTEGVGNSMAMWVDDVKKTVTPILGDTSAMTPAEVNFVINQGTSGRTIPGTTPANAGGTSGTGGSSIVPPPPDVVIPEPPHPVRPVIPIPPLDIDLGD